MAKIEYNENGIIVDGLEIPLKEITDNILMNKILNQDLSILTMRWAGGRGFDGCQESIVYPKSQSNHIKRILTDSYVYFGEIAGKHSEIDGHLEAGDIRVESHPEDVLKFLLSNPSGREYDHSFMDAITERKFDYGDEYLPNFSESNLADLFNYKL